MRNFDPSSPRPTFDPGAVTLVALVEAGFIGLVVAVLRPDRLEDRLVALAIGFGLAMVTLLVAPRARAMPGRSPGPAPSGLRWPDSGMDGRAADSGLAVDVDALRHRVDQLERDVAETSGASRGESRSGFDLAR